MRLKAESLLLKQVILNGKILNLFLSRKNSVTLCIMALVNSFALSLRIIRNCHSFLFMMLGIASLSLISIGKMKKIKEMVYRKSKGKTLKFTVAIVSCHLMRKIY